MKVLLLGAGGMAGHMLLQYMERRTSYRVFHTSRDKHDPRGLYFDATDSVMADKLVEAVSPEVIVNCIGILNNQADRNRIEAYTVNGLLPHRLRQAADRAGARLIHISTDCVFSGRRGDYAETDLPDGTSVYALTKALGEVIQEGHLTIRTSIIGPEISRHRIGLLDWFMRQEGQVQGYTEVLWNGVTTLELAKAVHTLIESPVSGLVHLTAPGKISKCELLYLMRQTFGQTGVTIIPDDAVKLDRTLRHTRKDFVYAAPPYEEMLGKLHEWMKANERA